MAIATPQIKNRLTVRDQVYHRAGLEQPELTESLFTRDLESDEQVYHRRATATEQWKPLDVGWVEQAGMLVVKNVQGQGLQRIPTPVELQDTKRRVIELGMLFDTSPVPQGFAQVPPGGESARFMPLDAHRLYVRCQYEQARFTIACYPS